MRLDIKKDMQDLEERLRKEYEEKLANQEPKKKESKS